MTTLRRVLLVLSAALLTAGLWAGAVQAATIVEDTGDYVTFGNDDGQWTIYKRCVGTDTPNGVGPAYISRFVTSAGYTAVNGIGNGGAGETNNPARAGLGIFHWAHARGSGPYDWNFSWNMSNRRCAFDSSNFGVSQWSSPFYGIDGGGTGYYDQDVYFSDDRTSPSHLLWVRYRWRFDASGVRMYAMVVQDCTWGSCGSDLAYVKGPKFAANLNGQLSSTRPVHMSTLDGTGKWLGNCSTVSDPGNCITAGYECSYTPRADATQNTGHCFYNGRVRTRIDYGSGSTAGGCNTSTQLCFNVVSRAYPLSGLDVVPGFTAPTWEGSGLGFDQWAIDASGYAAGGSGGCGVEGTNVTNTADQLARSWEYAVRKQPGDNHFDAAGVMAKGWEDCTTVPDASALFRTFGPWDKAYGAFMSFSINSGFSHS